MSEESLPISVELILAAILNKNGKTAVLMSDLIGGFDGHQIAVEEGEEGYLTFELVKEQNES